MSDSSINDCGRDRGVSPVVGTLFILLIALVTVGIVVMFGVSAMEASRDRAQTQQVRVSMQELADSASSVAGHAGRSKTVDLATTGGRVDPDAGSIRIAVDNGSGVWSTERTLGAVEYGRTTSDGQETIIAYQGGGVWESAPNSDAVSIVSAPPVEYRERGQPTLTFPLIRVAGGSQSGTSLTVESAGSATSVVPASMVPLEPGSTVNLTVTSEYYRGWGQVFERQIGTAAVHYDPANESVTVSLYRAQMTTDTAIRSSVYSPNVSTSGSISNVGRIGSYEPGSGTGTSGAARFEDDVELTNDAKIGGELHVDGDLTTSKDFTVTGPAYVSGDALIKNDNVYESSLSVGGDLSVDAGGGGGNHFHGPVRVGGSVTGASDPGARMMIAHDDLSVGKSVTLATGSRVAGTLTAGGSVTLDHTPTYAGHTVGGDVIAGEDVTVNAGTVGGSVRADDRITVAGGTIDGDVRASGDVVLTGGTVHGDVVAGGTVHLHKGAQVEGLIRAGNNVIVHGGHHGRLDTIEAGGTIRLEPGASVTPRGDETGVERIVTADEDVILEESSDYYGTHSASLQANVYAGNADGFASVRLQGEHTQIKGDVYVHDASTVKVEYSFSDYACSDNDGGGGWFGAGPFGAVTGDVNQYGHPSSDRITGCVHEQDPLAEQPSAPSTPDTAAPVAPDPPVIYDDKLSVNETVSAHASMQADSDTSPVIESGVIKPGATCSSPCTLTAGDYALSKIVVPQHGELVLDTSDGPIEIYLTESLNVGKGGAGTLRVVGDNRVTIYHSGDRTRVQMGGTVTTESGSARQLWIYQRPDSDTAIDFLVGSNSDASPGTPGDQSSFTGVFYGYNPDGPNTEFAVDKHGTVYGAVLGRMRKIANTGKVYYDETLGQVSQKDAGRSGYAEIVYLRSSNRAVTVR